MSRLGLSSTDVKDSTESLVWHVGDVIRKLRERRRWNQTRLAKEAGLNKATVVRLEEHATGIKLQTYEAVARALRIPVGELFLLVPMSAKETDVAEPPAPSEEFRETATPTPSRRVKASR